MDNNLDASISMVKFKKTCMFKYIDKTDLLIIGSCLDGEKRINYKGENCIRKGEVFYFRPSEDFSIDFFEHSSLCFFMDLDYFENSLSCKSRCYRCYGNNICKKGEIVIKKSPDAMESYISQIEEINNLEINNFLDYINIKGELFNYLNWIIKLRFDGDSKLNLMQPEQCYSIKAKKIIICNLENNITVSEIADELNISIYKLQKSFKAKEGTTVYDYIRKVKIDYSKIFLENNEIPIIDVAQKIGYENPSKFSSAFKDITGYTPTEYRNKIKD